MRKFHRRWMRYRPICQRSISSATPNFLVDRSLWRASSRSKYASGGYPAADKEEWGGSDDSGLLRFLAATRGGTSPPSRLLFLPLFRTHPPSFSPHLTFCRPLSLPATWPTPRFDASSSSSVRVVVLGGSHQGGERLRLSPFSQPHLLCLSCANTDGLSPSAGDGACGKTCLLIVFSCVLFLVSYIEETG